MAQLEELERLVRTHRNGRVAIRILGRGLRNGVIKAHARPDRERL